MKKQEKYGEEEFEYNGCSVIYHKNVDKEGLNITKSKTQGTVNLATKLEYIKIDTDTKMNDLKLSLENGYKKISELSNKELDELILIYGQDVKNLENELIYKKSLLKNI